MFMKQNQMKKIGNPNATFIKIKIENKNFKAYIDTGATLCFARKHTLPLEKWKMS